MSRLTARIHADVLESQQQANFGIRSREPINILYSISKAWIHEVWREAE